MRIENVKKVLLYCRPTAKSYESVKRTFQKVASKLRSVDVELVLQDRLAKIVNDRHKYGIVDPENNQTPPQDCNLDLVISIGGDGTFIHASSVATRFDVPLLGINAGTLGFLTAYSKKEINPGLNSLLRGALTYESRTRIYCEHYRSGRKMGEYEVFNDIIVKTGANPRLLDLGISVGGKSVVRYKADGVVVCTPSGSTAYNMACGGPILSYGSGVFGVTPICANGLTNRSMVFGESEGYIEVEYLGSEDSDAILVADGQTGGTLQVGDKVIIMPSRVASKVVPPDENVFAVLKEKMDWSQI